MSEAGDLKAQIGYAIDQLDGEDVIRPTRIASIVLQHIDPDHVSPDLVYLGCHLELRQLAREALRRRYKDKAEREPELFDLQDRYPRSYQDRDDPEYIKRELMTKNDLTTNVDRLRAEASSKLAHADALVAWWNERNPNDRC